MNSRIEGWLSIPKSIYVCVMVLPWKLALRRPIKVRYNVKLQSLKGKVLLPQNARKDLVQIGFQYVGTHDVTYRRTVLEIDGTLEFKGSAMIGSGSQLCVGSNGHLVCGNRFNISCSGHIVCTGHMNIGDNFLMGWDALLMDSDFHSVENVETGKLNVISRDVHIGENVWMAARSVILKGTQIPDGCIIGANSVVTGSFEKPNCVIAGNPARVIKEGHRRKS